MQLARTLSEHYGSIPKATNWWLASPPPFSVDLVPSFMLERERLLKVIDQYCPHTELGEQIREHALQMPLGALEMHSYKTLTHTVFAGGNGFYILAVPQSEYKACVDSFTTAFYFIGQGPGVLLFPAIRMSDAYLASTFLHEYGHGIRWLNKETGSKTDEEVLMHELTHDVLTRAVPGYEPKIREIISRSNTKDYKRLLAEVLGDDLKELDRIVHGEYLNQEVVAGSMLQYVYSIGFMLVDKHSLSPRTKGEIYDWVGEVNRQWVASKRL